MMPDDDTIDGEEHPFDYTGVHAFLFIDQVQEGRSPEQVVKLGGGEGVPQFRRQLHVVPHQRGPHFIRRTEPEVWLGVLQPGGRGKLQLAGSCSRDRRQCEQRLCSAEG